MKTYHKPMRNGTKPVIRKECPEVVVNGVSVTSGLPTMIVELDLATPDAHRKFRKFCKRKDVNIGWELLDTGMYVCAGGFDNLLFLTGRWWVKNWHWDHNAKLPRGSGAGDKPKRSAEPRFTPTQREGAIVVENLKDENDRIDGKGRHLYKPDPDQLIASAEAKVPTMNMGESLKAANQQSGDRKAAEDKLFWERMGVKAPQE